MDLGVLLTLPLESIAIRAVVATLACVLLVRLLLRAGLRAPGVRVATAVAPALTLVGVALLTVGSLQLPSLMLPVDGARALAIPAGDGYLNFAPMALPVLVGIWALVAGVRFARRLRMTVRTRGRARMALSEGRGDPRLVTLAARLADRLRIPSPVVTVVDDCPGGALVIGNRRPVVIMGERLLDQLDDAELEGVLAHELAHVKRRDNLVSTLVGSVRDLTFFVPGGGWAVRQLHRERELAADQVAVSATQRPGALASGLLKVLERGPGPAHPCAALAPGGSLVNRVRVLVDDQPPVSHVRRSSELVALASVVATAVVLALVIPALLAGSDRQRDAVAVVWSATAAARDAGGAVVAVGEARAFEVYRRSSLAVDQPTVVVHAQLDEHSVENRRGVLHACADDSKACPVPEQRVSLGMRPRPTITVDDALTRRWQATPVMSGSDSSDGFRVFWLARVQ